MATVAKLMVEIGARTRSFNRAMMGVTDNLRALDASTNKLAGSIMALAPVASPVFASLAGGAMGLVSSFGAAGTGVIGFGAVAVSTLGAVFKAQGQIQKANLALSQATTAKQRAAALKKLQQAYQGLDSQQQKALKSLEQFRTFWKSFAKSFEKPVVGVFSKSLQTLQGILQKLKPAFTGATNAIVGLMNGLNASLQSNQAKVFFDWIGKSAGPAITAFGKAFGNTMSGIMSMMVAFDPISKMMQNGLVGITAGFAKWAAGLSKSKAFQNFVNYVKTNGPILMKTLGNLVSLFVRILIALAPIGSVVLKIISVLAQFLNKLIAAHPIIAIIIGIIMAAWGAFTLLLPAILAIVGPIGIIGAALVGLGLIFTHLWQTNEKFRKKVIAIWTQVKTFFITTWNSIKALAMTVWDSLKAFWAKNGAEIMAKLMATWNSIWKLIKTVITKIMGFVKPMLTQLRNFWKKNGQEILQATKNVFDFIMITIQATMKAVLAIFKAVWPAISGILGGTFNILLGLIKIFASLFTGDWKGVWDGVKRILRGANEAVNGILRGLLNTLKLLLESAWNAIGGTASSKWNHIKNVILHPIKSAKDLIRGIVRDIEGFFSGIHLSLPRIHMPPLPHFHISGHFSLMPPSIPHIGVNWYANGGVFNGPSMIGVGEAGPEAVVPLSGSQMMPFARAIASQMRGGAGTGEVHVHVYLDSEEIGDRFMTQIIHQGGAH